MRAEGEVNIINKYMNFNCGDIKHTVGGRDGDLCQESYKMVEVADPGPAQSRANSEAVEV